MGNHSELFGVCHHSCFSDCGYRHIDTAKRYGVESYLARAIEDSQVDRSDLFISTKLWPKDYGKAKTQEAALGSMQRLETDFLDLYSLHWPTCPSSEPNPKKCIAETWRQLELLHDAGKLRSIGVSNFQVSWILMDKPEIAFQGLTASANFITVQSI